MFLKYSLLYTFLLVSILSINSQEIPFPEIEYSSPIRFPTQLSGTFGELRGRHFHAGLDIKSSNGNIGDPIYAVADGWVSRLRVSGGGYGQAIYIDHPNGTRSVYAHINKFSPELSQIVLDSQYLYQSFAVDLTFDENQLKIKRGQKIAEMGNKGHSYGPHLHFEMRNAVNDVPYNPHLFNIPFNFHDGQPPVIDGLEITWLDDNYAVRKRQTVPLTRNGRNYTTANEIKIPYFQKFSFSLRTHDRQNGTHNRNGVYSIEVWQDTSFLQLIRMDSIPYEITHQLEAHIDFPLYKEKNQRYHVLSQLPGNILPIYQSKPKQLYYKIDNGKTEKYRIKVSDFIGNAAEITLNITGTDEMPDYEKQPFNYSLFHESANLIQLNDYSLYFPEESLYSDQNLYLTEVRDNSTGILAPYLHIFNENIPLNKAVSIKYKLNENISAKKGIFLARCEDKRIVNIGSEVRSDSIIGESRSLGTFTIKQDTVPPVIRTIRSTPNPPTGYRFVFEIKDNVQAGRNAKPLRMWAELDGKWHLGEEEAMTSRFYVPVPEQKSGQMHVLKIYAEDSMGNLRVNTIEFKY